MNEKYIQSLRDAIQKKHGCIRALCADGGGEGRAGQGDGVGGRWRCLTWRGIRRRRSVMRGDIRMRRGGGGMAMMLRVALDGFGVEGGGGV